MKNLILTLSAISIAVLSANAQVGLSGLDYTQNFNTLGSVSAAWADNTSILGWYAANNNAGAVSAYTAFTVGSGGGTSSSVLYALGDSSSSERALGGAPASTRYSILGLRLVNDTGSIFNGLKVSYDLEQWSDRGTAGITLSYQKFAPGGGSLSTLSGWTTINTASSPLPVNSIPVTGVGNTTGLLPVTASAGGMGLALGDEIWLRWEITKIAGQNGTHGIDNVLVTVPEPSAMALALLGFLGLGLRASRRS